jgi:hypothetical protein
MWFGFSLLFQSEQTPSVTDPIWEESIIVLQADTLGEAKEKANLFASQREVQYQAANGDMVNWKFKEIFEVSEINNSIEPSGTEIISRFLKDSEVKSLKSKFD